MLIFFSQMDKYCASLLLRVSPLHFREGIPRYFSDLGLKIAPGNASSEEEC